ncbi:hypothetical protein DPX16_4055 [Anabarilius grahami]|uniref:Uncharacterized protein n=1 Tax=Anabarilius grahami TaxID=495550 RepID=A0A3N0XZD8_ANAGA|nr:hypothetical protein DPX16_4055 [Anabarilius grahami]
MPLCASSVCFSTVEEVSVCESFSRLMWCLFLRFLFGAAQRDSCHVTLSFASPSRPLCGVETTLTGIVDPNNTLSHSVNLKQSTFNSSCPSSQWPERHRAGAQIPRQGRKEFREVKDESSERNSADCSVAFKLEAGLCYETVGQLSFTSCHCP